MTVVVVIVVVVVKLFLAPTKTNQESPSTQQSLQHARHAYLPAEINSWSVVCLYLTFILATRKYLAGSDL